MQRNKIVKQSTVLLILFSHFNCPVFRIMTKFDPMQNNHINYIEFQAKDLSSIKQFYGAAFGWSFTDYGPDYIAFSGCGLDGGFYKSDQEIKNGALVILYHENLSVAKANVIQADGQLSKDIFSFPGGKRFQFLDLSGNELAVWSDQ